MNIPAAWTEALTRLHKAGFTEAFIGGGALRDLDHGVPPKDIDIFLRHRGEQTMRMIENALTKNVVDTTTYHAEYQTFNPEVVAVYEANGQLDDNLQREPPFNIIACGWNDSGTDFGFLDHHVDRFDLGLCRIAYIGMGVVERRPEYATDKANKTLTIVNPIRLERSIERAKRIRGRAYQGHTIIMPDGTPFSGEFIFDEFIFVE